MRAESPFDTLLNAIQHPNVVGRDNPSAPLTQKVLDDLIADKAKMQVFVQNMFKIRGSEARLSDDDASAFAWRAVAHLDNGAFLLHPHTLARACYAVSFSFSPTDGVSWHVCTALADIHAARRSLRGQAGTAVLLRVVGAAVLAHPTGVVWFYCAYHAAARTNVL